MYLHTISDHRAYLKAYTDTVTEADSTYMCLAPALILKSCFISRITIFRSLAVHLQQYKHADLMLGIPLKTNIFKMYF